MQLYQSCILLFALLAIISNTLADEDCKLSIERASLKASSTHLRIRGNIVVGNKKCKPTDKKSEDDVSTTVTFSSKKNLSFKDAKNVHHAGNECTITATWYNKPDSYNHSNKNTEVYVPFRTITEIKCNKDATPKPAATTTKKAKHKKTKKRTTTKKRKTTKKTTKKRKTTTKKKISSSGGGGYNGQATFFTPNQGACGDWNDDNDYIAALSGELYGSYSKESSLCNKKVKVTNKSNGKSVTVTVKDACESCDKTHIDLSPAAFAQIGKFDTGILKVEWHFL